MTTRRTVGRTSAQTRRKGQIARIHVLKSKLGLDDDTYRDLLARLTGKRSSSLLEPVEIQRVVDHLVQLEGKPAVDHTGRPHNLDAKPELTKLEALLINAEPTALTWAYANGIAQRMFRIPFVAWLDSNQLRAVIAALVKRDEKQARKAAKS